MMSFVVINTFDAWLDHQRKQHLRLKVQGEIFDVFDCCYEWVTNPPPLNNYPTPPGLGYLPEHATQYV